MNVNNFDSKSNSSSEALGYKVFKDLYNPALKEAKKSGLSNKEAMQKLYDEGYKDGKKIEDYWKENVEE